MSMDAVARGMSAAALWLAEAAKEAADAAAGGGGGGREMITDNRMYYVHPVTGDDNSASNGMDSSTPLQTVFAAFKKVALLDFNGHSVTVRIMNTGLNPCPDPVMGLVPVTVGQVLASDFMLSDFNDSPAPVDVEVPTGARMSFDVGVNFNSLLVHPGAQARLETQPGLPPNSIVQAGGLAETGSGIYAFPGPYPAPVSGGGRRVLTDNLTYFVNPATETPGDGTTQDAPVQSVGEAFAQIENCDMNGHTVSIIIVDTGLDPCPDPGLGSVPVVFGMSHPGDISIEDDNQHPAESTLEVPRGTSITLSNVNLNGGITVRNGGYAFQGGPTPTGPLVVEPGGQLDISNDDGFRTIYGPYNSASPPTAGQVLTSDGTGGFAWATP